MNQTLTPNVETPWGLIDTNPADLQLGELLTTDEGVELEVVGLNPLALELAPEVDEDWGE